jgi:four helix bundle protein
MNLATPAAPNRQRFKYSKARLGWVDHWIDGLLELWIVGLMVKHRIEGVEKMAEYTRRRNKNRGYMKLRVWRKAIELYKLVCKIVYADNKIDFKLRAQIADASQSVSSNISEGYSRRSINEYIQHVYFSLGSLSETSTRAIAFKAADQISEEQFEQLDALHYEAENHAWKLLESLEKKRDEGTWVTRASEDIEKYHPE